jgi:hypothetical protein
LQHKGGQGAAGRVGDIFAKVKAKALFCQGGRIRCGA